MFWRGKKISILKKLLHKIIFSCLDHFTLFVASVTTQSTLRASYYVLKDLQGEPFTQSLLKSKPQLAGRVNAAGPCPHSCRVSPTYLH